MGDYRLGNYDEQNMVRDGTCKVWRDIFGEISRASKEFERGFKIATLLISLSGFVGWKYFENYVWLALLLIAFIQIFTLIENQLIRSDKEIEEIAALKILYTKYVCNLERLWVEYSNSHINEWSAMQSYFELKQNEWIKIEECDGRLNIKRWNWLMTMAESETTEYITTYYGHEETN